MTSKRRRKGAEWEAWHLEQAARMSALAGPGVEVIGPDHPNLMACIREALHVPPRRERVAALVRRLMTPEVLA